MRYNSKTLPPNILARMPAEDRKAIGQPALLPEERIEKHDRKSEKELQRQIVGWLEIQGVFAGRQRMDKKSSLRLGWPDVVFVWPSCLIESDHWKDTIHKPIPVAVECKIGNAKQTPEQEEAQRRMLRDGWLYLVVRSLPELIAQLKRR